MKDVGLEPYAGVEILALTDRLGWVQDLVALRKRLTETHQLRVLEFMAAKSMNTSRQILKRARQEHHEFENILYCTFVCGHTALDVPNVI